ncbi:MAG: CoA transferase [Chloroflexi bacterium]|nr:CoA transferase [Chloroflexota bacterium]
MEQSDGALSPYRVLDLTDEKGLACGKLLGDLGADVIIVEPPKGHPARNRGPFYKDQVHPEKSLYWFALNTSKRSITLNLETKDGQALFRDLVKTAHFVIESFPVGYLDKLGLGYEALAQIKPDIIMTSTTPFGSTGPYSSYLGSDLVCQAMSGLVYICGEGGRPPVKVACDQAYFLAGLQAAVGSLMAHYYRMMTGEGQHVDVSIQQGIIGGMGIGGPHEDWWMNHNIHQRAGIPFHQGPVRGVAPRQPVVNECKDGYVAISALRCPIRPVLQWMEDSGWDVAELKKREWTLDTIDFLTKPERDLIDPLVDKLVKSKTKREIWEGALKYRVPWTPMQTPADLPDDRHLRERNFFVPVPHDELKDTITYPGPPANLSETPWRIRGRAPRIGEHNLEIYEKELGLSREELSMLKTIGAI